MTYIYIYIKYSTICSTNNCCDVPCNTDALLYWFHVKGVDFIVLELFFKTDETNFGFNPNHKKTWGTCTCT